MTVLRAEQSTQDPSGLRAEPRGRGLDSSVPRARAWPTNALSHPRAQRRAEHEPDFGAPFAPELDGAVKLAREHLDEVESEGIGCCNRELRRESHPVVADDQLHPIVGELVEPDFDPPGPGRERVPEAVRDELREDETTSDRGVD